MSSFFNEFRHIFNSRQSQSVILCGNVYDLFFDGEGYVPLLDFLKRKLNVPPFVTVVYELNGPIRISDEKQLKSAWIAWKAGKDANTLLLDRSRKKENSDYDVLGKEFDTLIKESQIKSTVALQFLRQLTMCSRATLRNAQQRTGLVIIVEAAEMLIPSGRDIASLHDADRVRVGIVQDWFSDPAFMGGDDCVLMIAESRSQINERIANLPQVASIEVSSPDLVTRQHYISNFNGQEPRVLKGNNEVWDTKELAKATAGLSIHAIRQLLSASAYTQHPVSSDQVVEKVEQYIKLQVGEEVVEFKKPSHTLEKVVGFDKLKNFLKTELIPRFRTTDPDWALPGAAVGGAIGSGKTFIFEAVAAELGVPVLVLKNLRSKWYGETDVIFERLRRALDALDKVIIFVDEADTQFGGVGEESHSTERRLTGKIQAMMSDSRLRGKVTWLLMTARIHLLSPDIRRPGRVGDLIIPVLDPEDKDYDDFCDWVANVLPEHGNLSAVIKTHCVGYSAAAFASLRSNLKAISNRDYSIEDIEKVIFDVIPPDIGITREYQTLQALRNCTRKSLLPESWNDLKLSDKKNLEHAREQWETRIRELERQGVK